MNKKQFLGVAYYPEAWEREQIAEDLDHMLEHGISCVRIAEFAWKTMEPEEGTLTAPYDCTDLIDGTAYRRGERIAVGKYGVKVLKRA